MMFLVIICIEDGFVMGLEYSMALINADGGRFARVLFCPNMKSVFQWWA
jgi:hypothetical protein